MESAGSYYIVVTGRGVFVQLSMIGALQEAYRLSINGKSRMDFPRHILCADTNERIDAYRIKSLWTELGFEKSAERI